MPKFLRALTFTLVAVGTVVHAIDDPAWSAFKAEFEKSYADAEEEALRYVIFKKSLAHIEAHNALNLSYTLKVTSFADFTHQEFVATLTESQDTDILEELKSRKYHVPFVPEERATNPEGATGLPTTVDWVAHGAVTPVKSQSPCNVCWAFAATAVLESAQQIRLGAVGGAVVSLSEQQAIDCVGGGCDVGGLSIHWLTHIVSSNEEVCTEAEYPFQARTGYKSACKESSTKCDNGLDEAAVADKSYVKSEADLMSAVYQQPVKISINADLFPSTGDDDQLMFALYSGGIIDAKCNNVHNHAVVVVGYGTENGVDYWKVRNSYGSWWGEKGYFRVKRNNGNGGSMCMMQMDPVYPKMKGARACADGYSTAWNYGCNSFCQCNNPDGSKRNHCLQCCKIEGGKCHRASPSTCNFGYSKEWNYACQGACGCNHADGSHKTQCDKCCRVSVDGSCWHYGIENVTVTATTATATPEPLVV